MGNRKGILSSDWLSERGKMGPKKAEGSQKKVKQTILVGLLCFKHSWAFEVKSFCHVINPLLTKLVRSR